MNGAGKAVALKYTRDLPAPFVVARGRAEVAAAIERVARKWGVAVVRDPVLTESLIEMETGEFIPEEYYRIVAELLVFIGRLDNGTTGRPGWQTANNEKNQDQ